jgi:hypothetical protein
MARNKSSVSRAQSYKEISEFWDMHDLSEHWDETESVEFEVSVQPEITNHPIDRDSHETD